jgi:hypothetical protein
MVWTLLRASPWRLWTFRGHPRPEPHTPHSPFTRRIARCVAGSARWVPEDSCSIISRFPYLRWERGQVADPLNPSDQVLTLIKAIVRALTADNGRSGNCESEEELLKMLDQDGVS